MSGVAEQVTSTHVMVRAVSNKDGSGGYVIRRVFFLRKEEGPWNVGDHAALDPDTKRWRRAVDGDRVVAEIQEIQEVGNE